MQDSVKLLAKLLIVFVCILGSGLAISLYFKTDLLNIVEIEVNQSEGTSSSGLFGKIKADMQPKLASLYGQNIVNINLEEVYEELQKDRRIKDVRISRSFPNTLKLVVEPHIPIANLLSEKGDRVYPMTREGSLFSPVALKDSADAPVLRGRNFLKNMNLRKEALELLKLFPEHGDFGLGDISEIQFESKKGYILILSHEASEVILGHSDFAKRIEYVGRVLQYLRAENLKGRVIDARFSKKVVVRLRNAS